MNIFGFAVDRAFVAFIVLELVSYAERHGLLLAESHIQNVQMLTDLLSWTFSAIVAVVWFISNHHKQKQKANIAAGITDATPVTLKTPILQQCLNTLKELLLKPSIAQSVQEITTTTTTSTAVPPTDTLKLQ